jgi:hypothetical protein
MVGRRSPPVKHGYPLAGPPYWSVYFKIVDATGCHSTPLTLLPFLGATPTAQRGRVFERQTDSHAHAKPWAWHPIPPFRSRRTTTSLHGSSRRCSHVRARGISAIQAASRIRCALRRGAALCSDSGSRISRALGLKCGGRRDWRSRGFANRANSFQKITRVAAGIVLISWVPLGHDHCQTRTPGWPGADWRFFGFVMGN